jgi:hypothetical protein
MAFHCAWAGRVLKKVLSNEVQIQTPHLSKLPRAPSLPTGNVSGGIQANADASQLDASPLSPKENIESGRERQMRQKRYRTAFCRLYPALSLEPSVLTVLLSVSCAFLHIP